MSLEIIRAIQNDIARFLLILLFAVIFTGGSYYYLISIEEERITANANLSKIKQKYSNAIESRKTIEAFRKRYEKLKDLQATDTENRLNWIDLIETTAKSKGIPYVKYKISKQEKLSDSGLASKFGGIDVFQSKMQLDIHMLHEGDLFVLIKALDENAKGLFDVESCDIIRKRIDVPSIVTSNTSRNFNTTCRLNWYTMKPNNV